MNVAAWLDGLAAAYRREMTKLESFEYLQELKTWDLSDEGWLAVKSLAKRRHDFFPTVSELEAISQEVRRQGSVDKPGSGPGFELFTHTDGRRYARRLQRD